MPKQMRKVKRDSIVAFVKAYAAECAHDGRYSKVPPKADWRAIVEFVTDELGMLRIPWAFSKLNGEMASEWTNAYVAAERRLKRGGKLAKAAPKPKARKRTAKPKASGFVTMTVTEEQAIILAELLAAAQAA